MLNEKFIGKTNEMEIAKLFYEFSIDDLNNEQAKKTIYELEKNSTDEALAKHCSHISITY